MAEEIDLVKLVIEIDDELIQKGLEPFQRPMKAYMEIAKRLQPISSSILLDKDPLFNSVNQIYRELYRLSDLERPPKHIGAFMFRDVFFCLRIPIIYGSPKINPVDFLIDITEGQKQWLLDDQQNSLAFFDQVIDLMDFVYGLDDLRNMAILPDKTLEWWYIVKQQLEAAAATVLGSFNKYAVIQNCCISTELLLKGALLAKGINENTLADNKKYGHNLEKLVNETGNMLPNFDKKTVLFVVKKLPNYVRSRYEAQNLSRVNIGNFLMNTQFIAGEILRQFSNRNLRLNFITQPDDILDLTHRKFPKQIN